jgi:hypothetical protein
MPGALSKPELYDLVRELHAVHHLPVELIAELTGRGRTRVYAILNDLGFKHLTHAERLLALPKRVITLCVRARKGLKSEQTST